MSGIISPNINGVNPGASQAVAVGASSTQSSAVGANTQAVLLCSTVACFVTVGASPTAVANTSMYLPANTLLFVAIGGSQKVAVIQASGAGSLYITEAA